ncbi:CG43090, partial [Drosophila busckii]
DAAITGKLRMIHEKFGEGYTKGNTEYKKYMSRVLEAIGWASERVADKNRLYDEYQAYNKVRLDLEEQTMKRIEEIVNNILLNLPKKSKCVKFYSKQKDTLKKSLTSSNGDRPKILADNSKTC